jgi:hypothetical protein
MRREFGLQLAVCDNGFVYVGNVHHEDGYYVITNCANVRKAGTERGFGQIAFDGPTNETALDYCPHVLVPEGRMCHLMKCVDEKWVKHIK